MVENPPNLFKEYFQKYLKAGYRTAPDKFGGKGWALSGISDKYHGASLDSKGMEEDAALLEKSGSNLSLILGEPSGVVALDVDTDHPEVLEKILPLLPTSPVEKRGSKGFTRFFKYMGEKTEVVKFNGEVVFEVLSGNKKTTLPPSRHPNGADYVWTSDKTLLDTDPQDLPLFPPFLVTEITRVLGGSSNLGHGKVSNGRNSALSTRLGELLEGAPNIYEIIDKLIWFDTTTHKVPYFTDPNEHRSTEPTTNALNFLASHLTSINGRRFREGKEYISLVVPSGKAELQEEAPGKKSLRQGGLKKLKVAELLPVHSVLKSTYDTLMTNSWVPQPEMALGTVLTLFSTLCSRKFVFQGMSPNLYVCNISKSGCVDKDTEFFNGRVWKPISEYTKGEKVLQYNQYTQSGELVEPLEFLKEPHKGMYEIKTPKNTINQVLTPGHRMIIYDQTGKERVETAQEFLVRVRDGSNTFNNTKIKTTFKFEGRGVNLSNNDLRLQIAYCVDGKDVTAAGSNNITVKRKDKIDRLSKLLRDRAFHKSEYAIGYAKFYFEPPIKTNTIPTDWAVGLSISQCRVVLDECLLWGGSTKQGGIKVFISRNKSDVDTLQFIAARLGIRSTIRGSRREGLKDEYALHFSKEKSDLVSIGKKLSIKKVDSPDGYKYCFRVPSDALILRRKGRIFITKNTGKNSGMEFLKNTLLDLGLTCFLGPSDIPSDAGLMDVLCFKPQMVLPLDEISGVLGAANIGSSEYNRKLGDLLCELYTLGTGRFLGRSLVEDSSKGAVDRPNLNILGATTPRGFSESVNRKAIQKGLLGRFLLFFGDADVPSRRVRSLTSLPEDVKRQIEWLADFQPKDIKQIIQGRPQRFTELRATPEAEEALDSLFKKFDAMRLSNIDDTYGPIAARLYQQAVKLIMVHALANSNGEVPKITPADVSFGKTLMEHLFFNFKESVADLIFDTEHEKLRAKLLREIKDNGPLTKKDLVRATRFLKKSQREVLLTELIESEEIMPSITKTDDNRSVIIYGANYD